MSILGIIYPVQWLKPPNMVDKVFLSTIFGNHSPWTVVDYDTYYLFYGSRLSVFFASDVTCKQRNISKQLPSS